MAQDGRALTPFAANVISILIIAFFTPLIMGWGMTSSLSNQDQVISGPTPSSGNGSSDYRILKAGNCSMTVPNNYQYWNINGNYSESFGNNTNWTSDDLSHDTFKYRVNQGFTSTANCGGGPYEFSIPADQIVSLERNLSSLNFRMFQHPPSYGDVDDEHPLCTGKYVFDARLRIQSDVVFEEYRVESNDCINGLFNMTTYGYTHLGEQKSSARSILWNPQFTPVESFDISEKVAQYGCGLSCNITIEIDRITHTENNTFDAFAETIGIQSATYEVDFNKRSFQLGLSAWFLAAFIGLATIASTPLWDPFKNHIQKLGSYDL